LFPACAGFLGDVVIFLRNLMRTRVRSLLTLLGVTVGTALFVSVATLTLDMQQQFVETTAAYNTEVMIGSGNALTPFASRISPAQIAALESTLQRPVAPMLIGLAPLDSTRRVPLLGVAEQSFGMIPVVGGKALQAGQPEVLIGVLCAASTGLGVGDRLLLGNIEYRVAGLFRSGSRYVDGGMIASLDQAHRILGRRGDKTDYNMAMVQTGDKATTAQIVEQVRRAFPRLRAQPTVEFSGIVRIMNTMQVSSWSIALIALLGAAIVVANTLVMVVTERTRELGVLIAIGWSPRMVLRMLFAEILALCLLGTLLGNLVAQGLLALLLRVHASGHGWNLPADIAPLAVAASLAAALLIALMAMLWPAHVVYRLKPAEALRHD
jgi:putative ABC transport system permease protein